MSTTSKLRDPDTATEPGTALNTVVIVTDPSTVKTSYEAPPPATKDEIAAVIADVDSQLPDTLTLDTAFTGTFDTTQAAQFAPDALRSDYAAFLEKYHHEFRASHRITNAQCDLNATPFMAISYVLDRFDTADDASAALNDGFLAQMEQVNGYTESSADGLDYPLYTQTSTACDQPSTDALTFWQRGRYVVTAEAMIPADHPVAPERWLKELVGVSVYEHIFSDALRRELR